MTNQELALLLIDEDPNNEISICVSGNFHKITGVKSFKKSNVTILHVEGSIQVIRKDHAEFYKEKFKGSSIIESVSPIEVE